MKLFSRLVVLGMLPLLLVACKQEKKPAEARTAQGEILPGSASDAMLPLDTVRSQPPLAPEAISSGKPGKTSSAGDAETVPSETASGATEGAAPAAGSSVAPETVQ